MDDPQDFPLVWNAEAHIGCAFSFRCPQVWDRLQCTADPLVRHCLVCDKAVHLAMTEETFERYRGKGICVAVPILPFSGVDQTVTMGSLYDPSDFPDEDSSYNSGLEEDD